MPLVPEVPSVPGEAGVPAHHMQLVLVPFETLQTVSVTNKSTAADSRVCPQHSCLTYLVCGSKFYIAVKCNATKFYADINDRRNVIIDNLFGLEDLHSIPYRVCQESLGSWQVAAVKVAAVAKMAAVAALLQNMGFKKKP